MASAVDGCAYDAINDPVELGIALRELRRGAALLQRFAALAFDNTGTPVEWAVGMRMAASLVTDVLVRSAEVRLLELMVDGNRERD